jgi:hypothetical protein
MITNSHKCQIGLHHRDGLIETIKMDIIICLLWSSGVKDITYPIDYGILTSSRRQHPTSPQTGPPAGPTTLGPLCCAACTTDRGRRPGSRAARDGFGGLEIRIIRIRIR